MCSYPTILLAEKQKTEGGGAANAVKIAAGSGN
jgi:hypothetical protein